MAVKRRPFQGVANIIRFNWHFYLLSLVSFLLLSFSFDYVSQAYRPLLKAILILAVVTTIITLVVSCYIYDVSDLYKFTWLDQVPLRQTTKIVNINAGFDETSVLLQQKFPASELIVMDFYDPVKHTEVSIKRARKAYPPFPATRPVTTTQLPLAGDSIDVVFALLSAHEIRNHDERISFFIELKRVINPTGQIIITEHLQDAANFLAYTIGFRHFHRRSHWLQSFAKAELTLTQEIKITPFITTFVLEKNGIAP